MTIAMPTFQTVRIPAPYLDTSFFLLRNRMDSHPMALRYLLGRSKENRHDSLLSTTERALKNQRLKQVELSIPFPPSHLRSDLHRFASLSLSDTTTPLFPQTNDQEAYNAERVSWEKDVQAKLEFIVK